MANPHLQSNAELTSTPSAPRTSLSSLADEGFQCITPESKREIKLSSTLFVHLWTTRTLRMTGITSNTTVADVLAYVVEEERGRSNAKIDGLQLVVGEKAVAPWRRVLDCFNDNADIRSSADSKDGLHVYIICHPSPQIDQDLSNLALSEQGFDSEYDTRQSAVWFKPHSRDTQQAAFENRFTNFMQKREEARLRQHVGGGIKSRRRGKPGLTRQ